MNYIIKSFNPSSGSIVVEFENEFDYNIDIPIEKGLYITGESLHNYILGFYPQLIIDRQKQIAQGISNADEIRSLVVPFPPGDHVAEDTTQPSLAEAAQEELQTAKITALINTVLDEREASNV